jgi:hypothetical protein
MDSSGPKNEQIQRNAACGAQNHEDGLPTPYLSRLSFGGIKTVQKAKKRINAN